MAADLPDRMRSSAVPPEGGGRQNPYAVGHAGAEGTPGDTTTPASAGAHYLPGTSAAASVDGGRHRSGLVTLAVLLVLGSLVWLAWHAVTRFEPLLQSLEGCGVDRGMTCFTGEPFQRWVHLPVLAVVLTWGFASGAATEGRQGRARGYLHLLAGVAPLVIAGLVSGQ